VHGTYTLTNPDTGRSMQLRFTINDEDLDVRLIDDGTATPTVLHAGRWAWTTSEGIRLLDAGMYQFEGIWNYGTDQFTFTRDCGRPDASRPPTVRGATTSTSSSAELAAGHGGRASWVLPPNAGVTRSRAGTPAPPAPVDGRSDPPPARAS
jgi:hypothetical protein